MKKTCLFFFKEIQMCILHSPLGRSYLKIYGGKAMFIYNVLLIRITFKDARSVSLYPYNLSQILQYVMYTK